MTDQTVYNTPANQETKNTSIAWIVISLIAVIMLFLILTNNGNKNETTITPTQNPQSTQVPQNPQSTQVPQEPQSTQVPQATTVPQFDTTVSPTPMVNL